MITQEYRAFGRGFSTAKDAIDDAYQTMADCGIAWCRVFRITYRDGDVVGIETVSVLRNRKTGRVVCKNRLPNYYDVSGHDQ